MSMKQVPDRKKLRRDYLKAKGGSYLSIATTTILIVPVGLMFLIFVIGLGMCIFSRDEWTSLRIVLCVVTTCFATLTGLVLRWFVRDIRATQQMAAQMEYVPPVTPATLPTEEILVRGSQEPPIAQSEVLLRAARGQETPKEELLRVSQE